MTDDEGHSEGVTVGRIARFLAVSVAGLAGLAVVGYCILANITGSWFEKDLRLRSQLAVTAAEPALAQRWSKDNLALKQVLAAIARDERIMGVAACGLDGIRLASTDTFPGEFDCKATRWFVPHEETIDLAHGRVHLSVISVDAGTEPIGHVLLVHDLSFLDRRAATVRNALVVAFFVLAFGAASVMIFAARFVWRGWTLDLRRALHGVAPREFRALVRDVRSLIDDLARERAREQVGGPWNPDRLRAALTQHLQGERVVILANREPYIHEKTADGVRVLHPASGLVTALEPVMRACSGVWVAHGAGSADRETVDGKGHVRVPPGEESYSVRRVWLTPDEEQGYYYGLSNEGLWPLCHLAHNRPVFREEDWRHYVAVNQRFAEAVCEEVDSEDPIVLVQDYHFALAPKMIRAKLPHATILTFWHIPWPNAERVGICPWREEILSGLLGSSIVGFQTQQHCNNFIDSVDAFMESRIDREDDAVIQTPRRTLVRPYPISIEWPVRWVADVPSTEMCGAEVREDLGLKPNALVGVGVDRLDYTKGVEERLRAVSTMLERYPEYRGRFTFIQLAAPSRTKIERYRDLNDRVEAVAAEVNHRWGTSDYRPIVLLRAHHEPPAVFRYYRAADLCYVSSLHDGMNLVAKEFVAARDDERGVLVLSQFTGAARDLTEALIVNPYDLGQAADALAAALKMNPGEQRERMRAMRRFVSEFNVYRWAGRMLVDAAELRRRDRLSGRLGLWGKGEPSGQYR